MGAIVIATPVIDSEHSVQPAYISRATIAFSASYATGGDAIDFDVATALKSHAISAVQIDPTADYYFVWDKAAGKVLAFNQDGTGEVTATTDLNAAGLTAVPCYVHSK